MVYRTLTFLTSPPTQKLNFNLFPNVKSQRTHQNFIKEFESEVHTQVTDPSSEDLLGPFNFHVTNVARGALLSTADGRQNLGLFVPGELNSTMRMAPMSPYPIMPVHNITIHEAKTMDITLIHAK